MKEYPFIALNLGNKYRFYHPKDIIYCKSDGNYTKVFFEDGKSTTSARKLKDLESLFPHSIFVRVHHSCIINMMHVVKFINEENKQIEMSNGDLVEVSRRKKSEFLSKFLKL